MIQGRLPIKNLQYATQNFYSQLIKSLFFVQPIFRFSCAGENDSVIQPLYFAYIQLLNQPHENKVILTMQNPPLECSQHLEIH